MENRELVHIMKAQPICTENFEAYIFVINLRKRFYIYNVKTLTFGEGRALLISITIWLALVVTDCIHLTMDFVAAIFTVEYRNIVFTNFDFILLITALFVLE